MKVGVKKSYNAEIRIGKLINQGHMQFTSTYRPLNTPKYITKNILIRIGKINTICQDYRLDLYEHLISALHHVQRKHKF